MPNRTNPVIHINPDDLADDEWDRIIADSNKSTIPAPRIGHHVTDHFAVNWEVWDTRNTSHRFAIYLGRAVPVTGPGGAAVILTTELVEYLSKFRRSPDLIDLPVSGTVIKRLRRALGHNWYDDGEKWWLRRMHDLETLTIADFAVKHRVKSNAVVYAKTNLLGPSQRQAGWWRDPHVADLLLSPQPRIYVAVMLDICSTTVGKYRSQLRRERGETMDEASRVERMRQAKTGIPAHPNTRAALLKAAQKPKSLEWRTALGERNRNRERPESWVEEEWKPQEDLALGTAPDRDVAAKIGRTINAVCMRRSRLRIPAFKSS